LSQERLGGVCHFNFCGGGETLLPPEMTGILRTVLEQGHYVFVVTNGTVEKRFSEILEFPWEMLDRLGFKFSFQFLELKRLNLLDSWFERIKRVRRAGCSISVELTPNDETIPYIGEIKALCLRHLGALCHVTVARDSTKRPLPILTKLPPDEYARVWGQFDSPMFDFKQSTFNVRRREFCYAGLWSGVLDVGSGTLRQCYRSLYAQNIFEDEQFPIQLPPVGRRCLEPHCFNSHAWLTLGLIPALRPAPPPYAAIRNRRCTDGSQWLTDSMNAFLSGRLYDDNPLLSEAEQRKAQRRGAFMLLPRIARKITRALAGGVDKINAPPPVR
jgi:hypothetical protein